MVRKHIGCSAVSSVSLSLSSLWLTGSHYPDYEDAQEDHQRAAANRAGGDPEEHVPAAEEDDQRADRVAHRTQVHQAGRDRH